MKKYYRGKLKFECDFLCEKENMKKKANDKFVKKCCTGKEYYYNGKLYFEGEYLNGKRWNGIVYNNNYDDKISEIIDGTIEYIKEYDIDDKLIFEGKYINREKNGYRKLYNSNGAVIFEG